MDRSQSSVAVREFRTGDEGRWDDFVLAHPGGTFFHLSGWKRVIEQAFRHRTYYLIAELASVLNFYFRDEVLPFYGGGLAIARSLAANDFMYWEVMRRACERGYRIFDFGRSKVGTGSYAFKRNWGFEPTPLVYQFRLAQGHAMPDLNPLNPKLAAFVAAWKHLLLVLTNRLGPLIVRGIG